MDYQQPEINTEKFILELREGTDRAFALLFDQYAGQVYRYSRKFGLRHEDAEGIIQEVFLKLWQKRATLDPQRSLNAYLYKITKSYIIKRKKKLLLEKVFVQLESLDTPVADQAEMEHGLMLKDFMALIFKWAALLPRGQREVFELRNKDHLTMDEIAEKLKIPKRKVENRMYQANKTLRSKVATDKLLLWVGTGIINFL
ncbi:RNA polymerase sigma factor [Cyclobacterium roseum]|uniref:RNA polymerase sigma factor n=1 Tax=Cyclobacterium roseum TaxID=2666137 RepID=UPI001391839F|nr:sigma-70 family RNA polymerase sigma factor [Cyclobacterium roseum]